MTAPTIHDAGQLGLFRTADHPGVWDGRGKVTAVGIGHSPTLRRWDGDPQKSIGAWIILAIRRAIEDAGVNPAEVDGLVLDPTTTTGAFWPEGEPVPQDFLDAFENTSNPFDGLTGISGEWLVKNMPELTGLKFVMTAPTCMSMCVAAAVESISRGMGEVVIAIKGWHNIPGRYGQRGAAAQDTVAGPGKYGNSLAGPPVYGTAMMFQRYMYKYGKTHDMMAPFVTNSRANGLKFPEGYWYQHRNNPLTTEEYLQSRWVAEPANLYDNDIPIHTAAAFLFTTAERGRDLRQPPVYVLGHASGGRSGANGLYAGSKSRSTTATLEEWQEWAKLTGARLFESSGITPADVHFENAYDGFSLFHVWWIEEFGFFGIKRGEALDFFASQDISINGPTPISPSGGNIGSGRTRFWMWSDTIQQLQGRAGERQVKIDARVGVAGGWMPVWSNFAAFSKDPV